MGNDLGRLNISGGHVQNTENNGQGSRYKMCCEQSPVIETLGKKLKNRCNYASWNNLHNFQKGEEVPCPESAQ